MMTRLLITLLFLIAYGSRPALAQQRGMASYYSNRMHGRRMSNGDKYHKDSLTCAHAKFALGTLLKVTNVTNGKSVVVEVTDRCSSHARRIIDLSLAAARRIDLIAQGMATVLVEKYTPELKGPYREDDDRLPELDLDVVKGRDEMPAWGKK